MFPSMKADLPAIRLRSFDRLSDVPSEVTAQLMRLGLRGGWMRRDAIRHDPPTVVASIGSEAIGWLTVCRPEGARPYLSVFVHEDWRRVGVGRRLVREMNVRFKMWERPVTVNAGAERARKFYDAAGFTDG
jgi:GNAT superfamily N-acetyltransferase